MKVFYSDKFVLELPKSHRFPILKYELIKEQLLHEGIVAKNDIIEAEPIPYKYLSNVHDKVYIEKLLSLSLSEKEIRKMGFPLTKELVEREFLVTGASYLASMQALKDGIAFNGSGGTHHAFASYGEGFCLFNDFAVAAKAMKSKCKSILIYDLDVHQGNGTAQLLQNEPTIFTCSVHCSDNFPYKKEKSDLDIGLNAGVSDDAYLECVDQTLSDLIRKVKPDFVYYLAGVDILESDKLGKLSISIDACKERDEIVLRKLYEYGIPVVVAMGGGYSPKIKDIVNAHCNTFKVGRELYG